MPTIKKSHQALLISAVCLIVFALTIFTCFAYRNNLPTANNTSVKTYKHFDFSKLKGKTYTVSKTFNDDLPDARNVLNALAEDGEIETVTSDELVVTAIV
jgi:hypothetical protein